MQVKIYNTLTGRKEPLNPRDGKPFTMYTCGPTVYDSTHAGHLLPALVGDVVKRYLQSLGYEVIWAHNFTDVEDKIIRRAREEGVPPEAIAERYIDDYLQVLEDLGIDTVDVFPKVSDHMPDIIKMIQGLIDRGHAYELDGSVYFDVRSFPEYGKLSGRTLDELIAGARVEVDERKRHPADFALWKAAKPGEPAWDSPWGPGRPGWHIECSVMSKCHLGYPVDLHGGGIDLIFPHHENEIAQSEAYTGEEPFVRYWIHNGLLEMHAEKMSKSLGNFVTARALLDRYGRYVLRFYMLSHHYRSPREFSEQRLEEAKRAQERLQNAYDGLRTLLAGTAGPQAAATGAGDGVVASEAVAALREAAARAREQYAEAMADDFNTAEAIAALFELARAFNRFRTAGAGTAGVAEDPAVRDALEAVRAVFDDANRVLGVLDASAPAATPGAGEELVAGLMALILDEREIARRERDWVRSDRIRDRLRALNIVVEDTPAGPRWYQERPS